MIIEGRPLSCSLGERQKGRFRKSSLILSLLSLPTGKFEAGRTKLFEIFFLISRWTRAAHFDEEI